MKNEIREQQRVTNVLCYIMFLCESAFRLSSDLDPFDFSNRTTVDIMYHRCISLIDDETISCEKAHDLYVTAMLAEGWTLGDNEDHNLKTMPDLKLFKELSREQVKLIAYRAAVLSSGREFYQNLKSEFEMNGLNDLKGTVFTYTKDMLHDQ